ncbi:MAG: hypothetical protein EOM52_09820 [Clostridia bacterium]|nr:hypothetical protein [Clostridia bacterium]
MPTRTQQLATRFRDSEVLFFAPARGNGKACKQPGRQVRPGLTVYTLPPPPAVPERAATLFYRGWRKQADFIAKVMARHGFRTPVLWTTAPEQVHLLDYLSFRGLVYDCDKEWDALPPAWEGDLAAASDVVFAASPGLRDRLSPCNANIALLPNGVNFPMFARTDLDKPSELRSLRGPILGFLGVISSDLDLAPIEYAAAGHPDWNFVLVGPVKENPRLPFLRELPNVRLLGPRPIVEIPDYVGHFDVCLDLQRPERGESDVIPRRIYEYLSTGKPIVSMLWPDQVEEFPDVIYGAQSLEEYDRLCQSALMEDPSWVTPRRRDYGDAAAWSRRADEVGRILGGIGLY